MDDKNKDKIYYIQQQADNLCAEISSLLRKDADMSSEHLNAMIKMGLDISMLCQGMLYE